MIVPLVNVGSLVAGAQAEMFLKNFRNYFISKKAFTQETAISLTQADLNNLGLKNTSLEILPIRYPFVKLTSDNKYWMDTSEANTLTKSQNKFMMIVLLILTLCIVLTIALSVGLIK